MNEVGVQYLIKRGLLTVKSEKSRTQQTIDTLLPGAPLFEIFFWVNTLRLGSLQIRYEISCNMVIRSCYKQ